MAYLAIKYTTAKCKLHIYQDKDGMPLLFHPVSPDAKYLEQKAHICFSLRSLTRVRPFLSPPSPSSPS